MEAKKPNLLAAKIVLGLFALILFFILTAIVKSCNIPDVPKTMMERRKDLEEQAYKMCYLSIEHQLNDPGSYDSPYSPDKIEDFSDSVFRVYSHFYAKNPFNATIKSNYIMTIKYISGDSTKINNWLVNELIINGDKIK